MQLASAIRAFTALRAPQDPEPTRGTTPFTTKLQPRFIEAYLGIFCGYDMSELASSSARRAFSLRELELLGISQR